MPPLPAENLTKDRRKLLGPGNLGQPLARRCPDPRRETLTRMSRPRFRPRSASTAKHQCFRGFAGALGGGSRLASHWIGSVVTALLLALSGGCLVTDPITFNDEPDLPPSILNKPGFEPKIGGMLWVKKARTPEWDMEVQVRDENIQQEIVAHWRIRHEGNMRAAFEATTVPRGDQPVRDFVFSVQSDDLREYRCHMLELAVSGSFFRHETRPQFFDMVQNEGDIAYATWWILEGDGELDTPDEQRLSIFNSCETIETLLTTTAERTEAR
jgi:hypothetical protein